MFVYIFKVTLEKFTDFFFLLWVAKESCETVVKSALNVLEERVSLLKDQLSWWFTFSQISKEETKIHG